MLTWSPLEPKPIPLPVYVKDQQRRYQQVNPAFEHFFNVKRAEILGKTVFDLLTPEGAAMHDGYDSRLFAGEALQSFEALIPTPDGRQREGIYQKALLTRPDGEVAGLVGTSPTLPSAKCWSAMHCWPKKRRKRRLAPRVIFWPI